jgi:SAM-dependent methyltransferase
VRPPGLSLVVDGAKALLPRRLREFIDATRHQRATVDTLLDYLEADERFAAHLAECARERWRGAAPDAELTWGRRPSGRPFVRKAHEHRPFTAETRVLEVGPGYGRLVQAALDLGLPFRSWTGVDISERNVAHLSERYAGERFRWLQGDIETATPGGEFDLCLSSLTLQHLFPTLERAARNIASLLAADGALVFDCREGPYRFFERDGVTWIRQYERAELREMLARAGYVDARFDTVRHALGYVRLCVIATKAPS